MKESHRKGITNHPDPESCAGGGNTPGEALTGAHAGQLLSSENRQSACRPDTLQGKATPGGPVDREGPQDAAESKNLSMCGNSMHENREAPQVPRGDDLGRSEKDDHKSDMHASGASDGPIVPRKQANKRRYSKRRRSLWRKGDRPRGTPSVWPRAGHSASIPCSPGRTVCGRERQVSPSPSVAYKNDARPLVPEVGAV